jgi:hypothetical protein
LIYVLTYEYTDKSAFYVCGVTLTKAVATAWLNAGDGQHKVYQMPVDDIRNHTVGHEAMKESA